MPDWREDLVVRLAPLRLAPAREAEIIEELSAHLEDRYLEIVAGGTSPSDAHRLALADLDSTSLLTDRLRIIERAGLVDPVVAGAPHRSVSMSHFIHSLWQDVRYGARSLMRQPMLSIGIVAMLAIGIGANTAIFSVFNGLMLRPLPVSQAQGFVGIYTSDFSGPAFGSTSFPDFVDFRAASRTCRDLIAMEIRPLSLDTGGTADRVFAEAVTANYFDALGVRPIAGRAFPAEADATGSSALVVIGERLWRRRFAADPAVVGTVVLLSGRSFTVIGVAPASYPGLMRGLAIDAWIPLAALPAIDQANDVLTNRGSRSLQVMGRLVPGATVETAQAEFGEISRRLHAAYPDAWTNLARAPRTVTVLPEAQIRVTPVARGPVMGFLAMLMVVVGLVLLVACANVANLLLARAAGRSREIATRLALGASRGRLVRQLLTEGVLLAGAGSVAGLLLARWGTHALMAFQPPVAAPIHLDVGVDARVLVVTVAMTLITALLCGLAPALAASRAAVAPALKDGALVVAGGRKSRVRHLLVIAQVTVSIVLLAGAGLFLRSLQHATAIDPGFVPDGLVMAGIDVGVQGYSADRGAAFYGDLLERTRALPSVQHATLATNLPLGLDFSRRGITVDGYQPRHGEDMEFGTSTVGSRYFETMGVRLIRGRGFTERDDARAPRVAVVNETFARRFWPNQDPIGRRLSLGHTPDPAQTAWCEVIGVAADGKYGTLGEEPRPFFYLPLFQFYEPSATLVVRQSGAPDAFFRALRSTVAQLDRALPVLEARTMQEHLALALTPARIASLVLGTMGGVGLLLATLGLYGVMAYSVARRSREIGIRLSLGATRADVVRLILRQGLVLTVIGAGAGLAIAIPLMQAISALLYGISPADPATFGGVLVVLAMAATAACVVPARRAMRVDPIVALRQE